MTIVATEMWTIVVGKAKVEIHDLELREDIVLDEVHLEGSGIRVGAAVGASEAGISSGEIRVRAVMSESNLNKLVAANLPADAPVRGMHIALLSGRARISGKALVSIVPFPFSIEAKPRVENGVRVVLDCKAATMGIDLPRSVVDILQQKLNEALNLDVSALEIPVFIDTIACDPGRLTATGRARIDWPPPAQAARLPAKHGDVR
jgi:hypothetical protein